MSLGSIIGGIAGGVIGFFVGGPVGAAYGFSIGFGLGNMIDPMTPDANGPGVPKQDLQLTINKVGSPIFDCLGTVKISNVTLLCYGKERSEAVYTEVSGGSGGDSQKQQTGTNYYMTWAVGICRGPVDAVVTIFKDEKPIWNGLKIRPSSGGVETISIEGFGTINFYFGTDDQAANSNIGEIIGDSTLNSPFRGLCYAVMDDCLLGNFNRMPSMRFIVTKLPELGFSTECQIQLADYNPIHAIWYILTELAGLSETWLNSTLFQEAADTIALEFRGVSILFSQQTPVLTYIEAINNHILGILKYNSDATLGPKLIREDYDVSTLETVDESYLLEDPSLQRPTWVETINEVKVQYSALTNFERPKGVNMIIWSYYGTKLDYNITAESIMNKDDSDWTIRCNTESTWDDCVTKLYPPINAPQAMAYSPLLDTWVVVRQGNGVLVGQDGKHWNYYGTYSGDWEDVVWVENPYGSGGYFVACNAHYDDEYRIKRSSDGIHWERFKDASGGTENQNFSGITATSSGRLIVCNTIYPPARNRMFMYSDNYGASWSYVPDTGIPITCQVRKLAYSPEWGAIVASTLAGKILYSTNNGMNWSIVTVSSDNLSLIDVLWHPTLKRFFIVNNSTRSGIPLYSLDSGWNLSAHPDLGDVLDRPVFYRIGSVPGQNYVLCLAGDEYAYLFDFNSGEYYEIWYGCTSGGSNCELRSTEQLTIMTVVGSRE